MRINFKSPKKDADEVDRMKQFASDMKFEAWSQIIQKQRAKRYSNK